MLVEIGDLPAVCHSMDCGFTYIASIGQITSFTFSDDTDTLQVTGTELPTSLDGIQSLAFAQSPCIIAEDAVLDGTSIICTLSR